MIILNYWDGGDRTTTVGVFASEVEAHKAIQEFLDAYKKQEIDMNGYWEESFDGSTLDEYRERFRLIPAELNQIVNRSVGFVYDWL